MIELDYLQQVRDDIQEAIKDLERCEDKMNVVLYKDVLRTAKYELASAQGWLTALITWIREKNDNKSIIQ